VAYARERVNEEIGRTMNRAGMSAVGAMARNEALRLLGLDEIAR